MSLLATSNSLASQQLSDNLFQCHPDYEEFSPILPEFSSKISVFHSAAASFYAPSDLCGASGMYHEQIHANPNWKGHPQFDTVFVTVSDDDNHDKEQIMHGMLVACTLLVFSISVTPLYLSHRCFNS
jgi:hypothetical protein